MRKYILLTMMLLCAYNAQAQSCGENCSYTLTADGLLTIFPTDPNIETVIKDGAFHNRKDITNVVIQEGITSTGIGTFEGCSNLTGLKTPSSLEKIEAHAFSHTNLSTAELSAGLKELGYMAFISTQLTEIKLPSTLEKIDAQVFQFAPLKKIDLPDSLTYLGQYSLAETDLDELYIPDNVSTIGVHVLYDDAYQRGVKVYCSQNNRSCLNMPSGYLNMAFSGIIPWRYTKNADGSVYLYDEKGNLKTIRGKKIYTVEEAEAVTANGDKFHVKLTYK